MRRKISYLEQHHDEYDSYFLGCSSTSSLPTESFNEMLNAKFYNLIMYGADMKDCEKIANYLIDNYTVKKSGAECVSGQWPDLR